MNSRRLKILHLDLLELEELLKTDVPVKLTNPLPKDARIVGEASAVHNMFAMRFYIESEEFPEVLPYECIFEVENPGFVRVEAQGVKVTACCGSRHWHLVNSHDVPDGMVRCEVCGWLLDYENLKFMEAE